MEYSWLVMEVRKLNETKNEEGMSSAIDQAIHKMPDDFLIKPFLETHRMEVKGMLLEEYNEAETMELFKEEGREEGREEGKILTMWKMVNSGLVTIQQAADFAGMSEEDFLKKVKTFSAES